MATISQLWTNTGSGLATLMFVYTIFKQFFPQFGDNLEPLFHRIFSPFYPYIQITFHEYSGEHFKRSEAYLGIQSYLSKDSSARAKKLKASTTKGSKSLVLSMDDKEEITDDFEGVRVWWQSKKEGASRQSFSFYPEADEKRFYMLRFHRRDREVIIKKYLDHVMREGKTIELKNRERKLYSNTPGQSHGNNTKWSHVTFEHPATFDTLAMEETKKEEIKSDLVKFSKSKDYYKKIGKAWKRGYLLFGPPGTGKSTMIAAMANFLEYDVYDLELTTVKDNTHLRRLLIETSAKSIIVIEDIDCSLNLTGQRKKKEEEEEDGDDKNMIEKKMMKNEGENKESKVTLSGLLNFIDGLWSACGGERIIVFTTNFVDKLDPALIRKGRMDKHIEMSYCCFEAFKVLAKNYLDVEESEMFEEIKRLLEVEEIKMTPADVGGNLLPKSEKEGAETCLKRLIEALKEEKEEAKRKVEEEAKKRKEEEEEKKRKKEKKAEMDAEKEKKKKIEENGEEECGV
ncbi:PREDICTED: AAA-ATPase At3g28580 [Camelina sativa]|uniref:AAA-ATPase At3g28580 n=1 Tax=Camelina sativa TaxID=90675 RepID=A0ABM0TFG4_CAMSA|nr:PREDICTED: AAA-ATPase At3g28580 [Camelina sativa]